MITHPVEIAIASAHQHLVELQSLAYKLEFSLDAQALTPEQRRLLPGKINDLVVACLALEQSFTQSWEESMEWRADPLLHPDRVTAA